MESPHRSYVTALFRELVDTRFGGKQVEAAKHLGFPQRTIGRWVNGDTCPSLEDFLEVCKKAGIPPWQMLRPKESGSREKQLEESLNRIAEEARRALSR